MATNGNPDVSKLFRRLSDYSRLYFFGALAPGSLP
jgi:hypothetical protein